MIQALFFDLDGTLCDTDEANFQAYKQAFADHGHPLKRADYFATNGQRADTFLPKLLKVGAKDPLVEQVWDRKAELYGDFLHLTRPNRATIDFLRAFTNTHITVLVTTAKQRNAEKVLAVANISDLFDHKIFGDHVTNPKPDPEIYLKGLKLAKVAAHEVVAFEDSPVGLAAAEAAGIPVIKVTMEPA